MNGIEPGKKDPETGRRFLSGLTFIETMILGIVLVISAQYWFDLSRLILAKLFKKSLLTLTIFEYMIAAIFFSILFIILTRYVFKKPFSPF